MFQYVSIILQYINCNKLIISLFSFHKNNNFHYNLPSHFPSHFSLSPSHISIDFLLLLIIMKLILKVFFIGGKSMDWSSPRGKLLCFWGFFRRLWKVRSVCIRRQQIDSGKEIPLRERTCPKEVSGFCGGCLRR